MDGLLDLLNKTLVPLGVPLGILLVVFGAIYLIVRVIAQRRERQILAQQGINPDAGRVRKGSNPYGWLKPAGLLMGLGLGFLITIMFSGSEQYGVILVACLLIFAGLGMLGGYFLERSLRKKDEAGR